MKVLLMLNQEADIPSVVAQVEALGVTVEDVHEIIKVIKASIDTSSQIEALRNLADVDTLEFEGVVFGF